jgi:hypothetical protein
MWMGIARPCQAEQKKALRTGAGSEEGCFDVTDDK